MLLKPSNKPKKFRKADRERLGIPFRYYDRTADWQHDHQKAERVQLCNLQKGERFRFLNEHGKPHGPRWTVVFDMADYKAKYGHWTKFYPYCSMMFRKEGDNNDYHIHHKENVIVKPIHGSAMAVLAYINTLAPHDYFPA